MHKLTEEGKATLRQVAKWAEAHPDNFHMSSFFEDIDQFPTSLDNCGTSGCLAGWTAHMALSSEARERLITHLFGTGVIQAIAHLKLSGEYDQELDMLFYLVHEVNSDNVVQVVETFISEGIDGVKVFLDLDEDYEIDASCRGWHLEYKDEFALAKKLLAQSASQSGCTIPQ